MYPTSQLPLLLETIKINEGEIYNLPYHQDRCNTSIKSLFKDTTPLALDSIIKAPPTGLYKCRIVYADTLHSIEYIPYQEKEIHSLKIVSSSLDYDFKYANRNAFNALLLKSPHTDEIIIEKDGYLTDSSMSNIAFYDGKEWITPKFPLLKGTMRQKLLDDGFLVTKNIILSDLKDYSHVALINAMIGFKILKNINPKEIEGAKNDN
jgi:4-amino-4-deoxychorismate lyase